MKEFNKNKELKKINIKQNKNKYIKFATIGISCLILIIGIIMFAFAYFETIVEFTAIKGKVKFKEGTTIVAIYEDDTLVDEIPDPGEGWEFDRAECTNGATATWSNFLWELSTTYSNSRRTKCTVYFKSYFVLRGDADNINSLLASHNSSSNVIDKGHGSTFAFDRTTDNNLRFVGSDPNNYVKFNNELWRIVGVMNNVETSGGQTNSMIKLRRADEIGRYSWDTTDSSIDSANGINQWGESGTYAGADLKQELNTDYLGNVTIGTDGNWYSGRDNNKNQNLPNTTISSSAQAMIEEARWHLGSITINNGSYNENWESSYNANTSYNRERSNNNGKICSGSSCNDDVVRTTSWTGKVALIYPSDYLYATSGGSTTSRSECITSYGSDVYKNNSDCKNNNWLHYSDYYQWTLSPAGNDAYETTFYIGNNGEVSYSHCFYIRSIFPVVHLKSSVSIVSGEGSINHPYILG